MSLQKHSALQNGKYRILEVIGQGGFGITYKAETYEILQKALGEIRINVTVAIKEFFLRDACFRVPGAQTVSVYPDKEALFVSFKKKLLERESLLVSQLRHPHIVTVLDAFEENNTAYMVMEYIDGIDLNKILEQARQLPLDRCLHYARQIGDALHAAHQKGVIHMDIKPANILIAPGDHVKIIDFGIAKQYSAAASDTQIKTTTVVGYSPHFAPPEQYSSQSREVFTPATDIYAFGGTLYQCLTGVLPFDIPARIQDEMPTVHDLNPAIPEQVSNAIAHAMQLKRIGRYQTVNAFLGALLETDPQSEDPSSTLPPAPPLSPLPDAIPDPTTAILPKSSATPELPPPPKPPKSKPKTSKSITPDPPKSKPKAPISSEPKAPTLPKPKGKTPSKHLLRNALFGLLAAMVVFFIYQLFSGKKPQTDPDNRNLSNANQQAATADSIAKAQNAVDLLAFNTAYKQAEEQFKQGKYGDAEKAFAAAKKLPGCPAQNNIDAKIKECQQRLADEAAKKQAANDAAKKQAADDAAKKQAAEEARQQRLNNYELYGKNLGQNYMVVQRKSDNRWGIIDTDGNVRVAFNYRQASGRLQNGYFALLNDQNGWDVFNASLVKIESNISDLSTYR